MKTPKSPDYAALATQQGKDNRETALFNAQTDRPDETNIYGTRKWSYDPTTNKWAVVDTPNETETKKYNLQGQADIGMLQGLVDAIPTMAKAIQGNYSLPGAPMQTFDPSLMPKEDLAYGFDPRYAPKQDIQNQIDVRGLSKMPTADTRSRQVVSDALYRMTKQYLDPQFQQQENSITSQLRNEGINPNSEAYKNAMANFTDTRQKAYGDARDRAIAGAGQEMTNDFGMGMARNAQDFGQRQSMGTFANNAVGQAANIANMSSQLRNSAWGQALNAANASSQLYNTGRAQSLQELIASKTLPVNVLTGIMNGTQVGIPQFQTYNNQISAAPAPIFQAGQAQGQFNVDDANQRNAFIGNMVKAGTSMFSFSPFKLG